MIKKVIPFIKNNCIFDKAGAQSLNQTQSALKQLNLNKLSDASGFKIWDCRGSHKMKLFLINSIIQIALLTLLSASAAHADQKTVAVCTHSSGTSSFWSLVYEGMNAAGSDMGIKPVYYGLFDPQVKNMPGYISKALKASPSALIISIPDSELLRPSIEEAQGKGVPVIAIGSGFDEYASLGINTFIGEDSFEAGVIAGERMLKAGVSRLLCVHDIETDISDKREIEGVKSAFKKAGKTALTVAIRDNSPSTAAALIATTLSIDLDIDGIIAMSATAALPSIYAIKEHGKYGELPFATFDLSDHVRDGIQAGKILFAVAQQPYLEGYLAVAIASYKSGVIDVDQVIKKLQEKTGFKFTPPESFSFEKAQKGAIFTGPLFITKENLSEQVKYQ
ncbi:MAG: substrate-binding domain-containing protein [Chlamydiales bacterium]|nr:substrate-binding domain-containing protein [Chlamydiales bacterium]